MFFDRVVGTLVTHSLPSLSASPFPHSWGAVKFLCFPPFLSRAWPLFGSLLTHVGISIHPWLRSHYNTLLLGAHTTCTVCQPHSQPSMLILLAFVHPQLGSH